MRSLTEKVHALQEEQRLGALCVIVVLAMLMVTLWPFDFFRENSVTWLPEANGIAFGGKGVVAGKSPLGAAGGDPGPSRSLEVLLRPASVDSLHTILGFYMPDNPRQFLVRQWTDGLLVSHDVVDSRNRVSGSKFDVDHAFQQGKLVLLTMTSGPHGTVVYLNGILRQSFPGFAILPRDLEGQIVVGTSPVDYDPWPGEVRGLVLYARELTPAEVMQHYESWTEARGPEPPDLNGAIASYAFSEGGGRTIHSGVASGPDLEIPARFIAPHKPLLNSPANEFESTWNYVRDFLGNIAGFIPLGFVFCAYWGRGRSRRQAVLYAMVAGGVLSFAIEVLQAYVPQRHSDMTDLITNTLGAMIGAMLARPLIGRANGTGSVHKGQAM